MSLHAIVTGLAAVVLAGTMAFSPVALAQNLGVPVSPIVTLDQDRLFSETRYGQRVTASLQQASELLAAENRVIEAELIEEEQALTEQRATLSVDEFRTLADAFDEKVTVLREEQDAKTRALQRRRDLERQAFINRAAPILAQLVRDTGAVAILDARAVVLSAIQIDITDEAIRRIDDELGDGARQDDTGGTDDDVDDDGVRDQEN